MAMFFNVFRFTAPFPGQKLPFVAPQEVKHLKRQIFTISRHPGYELKSNRFCYIHIFIYGLDYSVTFYLYSLIQGGTSLSQCTPPPMKRLFSDSGINPTGAASNSQNSNKKPGASLAKLLDFSDLQSDFGLSDLPMTPPPPPACPPPPPSRHQVAKVLQGQTGL